MASPLHRHQASLEGIIDFSAQALLTAEQRDQATRRFYHVIQHFEASHKRDSKYNRPSLVRLTYEYARPRESQDNFLRAFFQSMALSLDDEEDIDLSNKDVETDLHSLLFGFADYLFDNFFLPLKASTRQTPQPTPQYHSSVQSAQGDPQRFVGTRNRVSALRGACLTRDGHRCVISQKFDQGEMVKRIRRDGSGARDDDGNAINVNAGAVARLEVAHILPHSLTKVNAGSQLDSSRRSALEILNMFDSGVVHLIDGLNIDRTYNAMSLSADFHDLFGNFDIFFEPIPDQAHTTYRIDTFLPSMAPLLGLPVTRTLRLMEGRTIDPPSPRLLAIHNAIGHIFHLSAAGAYIDHILRDMEDVGVRADGSTELGRLVQLGLGGWLDTTVGT